MRYGAERVEQLLQQLDPDIARGGVVSFFLILI
jgi:hypothetical protein